MQLALAMHELALIQDLVEFIEAEVTSGTVCSVTLEIGAWAAVDPRALRQSFDVCIEGTRLEGAALHVVEIPVDAKCGACGARPAIRESAPTHVLVCECGSSDVTVLTGRELRLVQLETSGEDTTPCV